MSRPDTSHRRAAFTLLELLVVIAMILIIVGLVLAALGPVRAAASRTESSSALRQLCQGFTNYSRDHRERFLPGYINPATQTQLGILVKTPDKDYPPPFQYLNPADAAYYTWRLEPYLDSWRVLFTDYRSPQLVSYMGDNELANGVFGPAGAAITQLGLAHCPSYGMNSIFIGGDTDHGTALAVAQNPYVVKDSTAATHLSEVKNASKVILFGPSEQKNTGLLPVPDPLNPAAAANSPWSLSYGYAELRPPYLRFVGNEWTDAQWLIADNGKVVPATNAPGTANLTGLVVGVGFPVGRSDVRVMPVGHVDGSVSVENIGELSRDMTRWSPFEISKRPTGIATP